VPCELPAALARHPGRLPAGRPLVSDGQPGWSGDQVSRFKENFGARAYEFPEFRLERLPITRLSQIARAAVKRVIGMPSCFI
jgi:hypothetical protein